MSPSEPPYNSDELKRMARDAASGGPPPGPDQATGDQNLLTPGSQLGSYKILRELGRGGMGMVYEAQHLVLSKRVALKLMLRTHDLTAERRDRFVREGKALASLNHPNIVNVLDAGEAKLRDDIVLYLAMELVNGRSLEEEIRKSREELIENLGTASTHEAHEHRWGFFREVAKVGRQIAEGLASAHGNYSERVIHRDIKPSNILIDFHKKVRIVDFGLARLVAGAGMNRGDGAGGRYDSTVHRLGTPLYMAPECWNSSFWEKESEDHRRKDEDLLDLEARRDLFALGVMLFSWLTGRHPFTQHEVFSSTPGPELSIHSLEAKILTGTPAADFLQQAKVPLVLQKIVLCCLERSPRDRYHSAVELAHDLHLFCGWSEVRPFSFREDALREAIVDLVEKKGLGVLTNASNAIEEVADLLREQKGNHAARGRELLYDLDELERALAPGLALPLRRHLALSPSKVQSFYVDQWDRLGSKWVLDFLSKAILEVENRRSGSSFWGWLTTPTDGRDRSVPWTRLLAGLVAAVGTCVALMSSAGQTGAGPSWMLISLAFLAAVNSGGVSGPYRGWSPIGFMRFQLSLGDLFRPKAERRGVIWLTWWTGWPQQLPRLPVLVSLLLSFVLAGASAFCGGYAGAGTLPASESDLPRQTLAVVAAVTFGTAWQIRGLWKGFLVFVAAFFVSSLAAPGIEIVLRLTTGTTVRADAIAPLWRWSFFLAYLVIFFCIAALEGNNESVRLNLRSMARVDAVLVRLMTPAGQFALAAVRLLILWRLCSLM